MRSPFADVNVTIASPGRPTLLEDVRLRGRAAEREREPRMVRVRIRRAVLIEGERRELGAVVRVPEDVALYGVIVSRWAEWVDGPPEGAR